MLHQDFICILGKTGTIMQWRSFQVLAASIIEGRPLPLHKWLLLPFWAGCNHLQDMFPEKDLSQV